MVKHQSQMILRRIPTFWPGVQSAGGHTSSKTILARSKKSCRFTVFNRSCDSFFSISFFLADIGKLLFYTLKGSGTFGFFRFNAAAYRDFIVDVIFEFI